MPDIAIEHYEGASVPTDYTSTIENKNKPKIADFLSGLTGRIGLFAVSISCARPDATCNLTDMKARSAFARY